MEITLETEYALGDIVYCVIKDKIVRAKIIRIVYNGILIGNSPQDASKIEDVTLFGVLENDDYTKEFKIKKCSLTFAGLEQFVESGGPRQLSPIMEFNPFEQLFMPIEAPEDTSATKPKIKSRPKHNFD